MTTDRIRLAAVLAVAAALAGATPAPASVTITPADRTVSSSAFELDFDNTNPEWLQSLRVRDSAGTLGPDLATDGGNGCAGQSAELWGQAFGENPTVAPYPVGSGSIGSWSATDARTVSIASSRPTSCTFDSKTIPVQTTYRFYETRKIRVERTFGFDATYPDYDQNGLRAYVPRLPYPTYGQVVHPDSGGLVLVTDAPDPDYATTTNWDGSWLALNDASTGEGMLILRDPATALPAHLALDWDGNSSSNLSSVVIDTPADPITGERERLKAPLTEVEFLCFYDAASWPIAERAPGRLPDGCDASEPPLNITAPPITGTAQVGQALTGSDGTWDGATSFAYEWLLDGSPIAGASAATYTPVAVDAGHRLSFRVTATAADGATATATSAQTASVLPDSGIPIGNVLAGHDHDAETGAFATGIEQVAPPLADWPSQSGASTQVSYLAPGGPGATVRDRIGGANAHFAGGPNSALSTIAQSVDVSAASAAIDAGDVEARVAAHLGGFDTNGDHAKVEFQFRADSESELDRVTLGPVTAGDRSNQTDLLPRTATLPVIPSGTRRIDVLVTMTRGAGGTYNDGYADNLSLELFDTSTPPATPDTTISSLPDNRTSSRTPSFTLGSDLAGATFECKLDTEDFHACDPAYTTPTLADGAHRISARATSGGLTDGSPAFYDFTVDATAPTTAITLTDDQTFVSPGLYRGPASVLVSASDGVGGSGVAQTRCAVDANPVPTTFAELGTDCAIGTISAPGTHVVYAASTDAAGNTEAVVAQTFKISPALQTRSQGAIGLLNDSTPEVTFFTEPDQPAGTSFLCRLGTQAEEPCSSPLTLGPLADGLYVFRVRSVNPDGVDDLTPSERTFTIDATAPTVTISADPDTEPAQGDVAFSVATSDGGASASGIAATACHLDPPAVPASLADLTEACPAAGAFRTVSTHGTHTFYAAARDNAGNETLVAKTVRVALRPNAVIDGGPAGDTTDTTPTFAFHGEPGDAAASFRCWIDDAATAVDCDTPSWTTPVLTAGPHTFFVRALNSDGLAGSVTSRSFTVNGAGGEPPEPPAPDTYLTSQPPTYTTDNTPSFEFGSTIDGSTFECHVDTDPYAACTSPYTTGPLPTGTHTFTVRAIKTPPGRVALRAGDDPEQGVDPEPVVVEFVVGPPDPEPAPRAPALVPPPAQLAARLTILPNPTCVGSKVHLDAGGSAGPSPIVQYAWQFDQYPYRQQTNIWGFPVGPNLISPWRTVSEGPSLIVEPAWVSFQASVDRPDIKVELTVTAADGSRASTGDVIRFAQHTPAEPTTGCTYAGRYNPQPAVADSTARLAGSVLAATVGCANHVGCSGSLEASIDSRLLGARTAIAARRIVLARRGYSTRKAGRFAIKVKLSKRALRRVRSLRRETVTLTVTTKAAPGKALVQRTQVSLRRPARRAPQSAFGEQEGPRK